MSSNKKMSSGYDASLPLVVDSVDMFYVLNKTLKDNIKQNVKMLFLTSPGERIMVPDYGVGLRGFLFERYPEIEQPIVQTIYAQVAAFLPEINIVQINVNEGDALTQRRTGQKKSLVVEFFYEISGTNIRASVIFTDEMVE